MNEAFIYTIRTETVRKADRSRLAELMPLRVQKSERFRFERDRLLCLGVGLLLLEVMKISDERDILYTQYEKPYIPGGPAFSISHSGSCCILACGEASTIGADIEEIDETKIDVAPAVYTGAELAWMKQDPVERFFRLWTWKESVMKATGLGMNLAPQSFEVLPFTEGEPIRLFGKAWYALGENTDGSCISVCADEPIRHLRRTELI